MAAQESKVQVDRVRQGASGPELRGHEQADTDGLVGACEAYEAALPIYRTIGDWRNEADTLDSLGEVKIGMDDLAGACEAYEAALLVYRKNADLLGLSLIHISANCASSSAGTMRAPRSTCIS